MKVAIKTLGCKANRYESDRLIEDLAAKCSFVDPSYEAEVYVVNTCTVTHAADRKSRQAIHLFRNRHPGAKILAFGCGPRVDLESYKKIRGVDFVALERVEIQKYVEELARRHTDLTVDNHFRTRAAVKIQDGCDACCSYCVIPQARGRQRSFPVEEILLEIKRKEKQGFQEIVLTGINIGTWRGEKGLELADLISLILEKTRLRRVRLSSIEPQNYSQKFIDLLRNPRFCAHMHMSLQSGSDEILKAMRRKYDSVLYFDVCERFRAACPDIALTTDVIVGFSGETEQYFDETVEFCKKVKFSKIHVFPFSRRKKTVAWFLSDQVPVKTIMARSKRLRALSDELQKEFYKKQIGKNMEVLFEGNFVDSYFEGLTSNYIRVRALSTEDVKYTFKNVLLKKVVSEGCMEGVLV